ncbi:MAG: carbon-nitrogen hydrolase family protein [Oscillospiraceae bacterium]|nr:carbon-nitrogen hydrolase family protein [Oscillospiraceae bacterium]
MGKTNKNKNLAERIKWTSWSPRKELSPEFIADGNKLGISSGNNKNVYGKFISGEISIQDSHTVIFEAAFSCRNVKNTEKSVFAMINFYDNQKKLLERDYAEIIEYDSGKTKKLYRKLDVPAGVSYAIIEIGLRWQPDDVVEFENISIETAEAEPPRTVRIATTYKEVRPTPEENLKSIINVIDKAGGSNPDVILLSELVYDSCYDDAAADERAQAIPGNLTDIIGGYAKKYNTYIIFTMNEKDGDTIYNTAVIIGRDGGICGKYRKIHLPLFEAELGTSPGSELKVFDLDFGKVGIIICYDQYFAETSRTLALMGAEIIFLPTAGEDEIIQRAISRSNGIYTVVSAAHQNPAFSRIINPLGEIVNFVKDEDTAYSIEDIDLNKRFFIYWMSVGPANGETKVLFRKE